MVENMFFQDSKHIEMGECSSENLPFIAWRETNSSAWEFPLNSSEEYPWPPDLCIYRNSDLILSHQHKVTWVIILTILVCIIHNHPVSHFILSLSVIIFLQRRKSTSIKLMEISGWWLTYCEFSHSFPHEICTSDISQENLLLGHMVSNLQTRIVFCRPK